MPINDELDELKKKLIDPQVRGAIEACGLDPDCPKATCTCKLVSKLLEKGFMILLRPYVMAEGTPEEKDTTWKECILRWDGAVRMMKIIVDIGNVSGIDAIHKLLALEGGDGPPPHVH